MASSGDPKSLGLIAAAAANTPTPITSSGFTVRMFTVQSSPKNAGTYVTILDVNGNIMAILTKGQSFTPPALPSQGIDLSQVQLEADTIGDGGFVSYV
jgi:hypothetical protein